MPMDWQTFTLALAQGTNQKADPRALQPPELALLVDGQFEEVGGIQPRLPYGAMSLGILGGGTITTPRKLAVDGDELLLFDASSVYSWSERDGAWVLRQAYVAPKLDEAARFVSSADQIFADSATLLGVTVTVWVERDSVGDRVYVGAVDSTTGAVLLTPTMLAVASQQESRPRVVAQASTFLFTWYDSTGPGIFSMNLDPANLAASLAAGMAAPTTRAYAGTGVYDLAVTSAGV